MQLARPGIAIDSRRFGRGRRWQSPLIETEAKASEDLRLFATTFAAGFIFVSVFLA